MFRKLFLMKRKPDISHRQFRDHYENSHRLFGERCLNGYGISYTRYYLYPMEDGGPEPIFDAVMMNTFPDRATAQRCTAARVGNAELSKAIAEDEVRMFDVPACLYFESESSVSKLQPIPRTDTIFRTFSFARHRAGMTHEQCRAYYESKHRLLGEYASNGYAYNYDRHFLLKPTPDSPDPIYTFMMEMNFPARAGFDQMMAKIVGDATFAKLVAEDEARFIDRSSGIVYRAEASTSVLEPLVLDAAA
jgi:hypothetical protein